VNGEREARIIDLEAETITLIDHREKTVRIVGFDELRAMVPRAMAAVDSLAERSEAIQERMQAEVPDTREQPSIVMALEVEDTGETRDFFGSLARRYVITMQGEVEESDTAAPEDGAAADGTGGGTLVLLADLWLVEAMPGAGELHDFSIRMAERLLGADPAEFFEDRAENMPSPLTTMGYGKALVRLQEAIDDLEGEPIRSATYVVTVPRDMAFDRHLALEGESAEEPETKKSKTGRLARGLLRRATGQQQKTEAKMQVRQRTLLSMIEETTEVSTDPLPEDAFELPEGYRQIEGLFGR